MPPPHLPYPRAFITQLFDALRAVTPAPAQDGHDAPPLPSNSNPLNGAPEPTKKQLLALHIAFPNELLPALDLLDRRLVTRFRIRRAGDGGTEGAPVVPPEVPRLNQQDVEAIVPAASERDGSASRTPYQDASLAQDPCRLKPSSDTSMLDVEIPAQNHAQEEIRVTEKDAMDVVYYVRSAQARSSRYSTSYDSTTAYEVRLRAWNCSCPAFTFSAFPSILSEIPLPLSHPTHESERQWSFGGVSLGNGTPPVCKHLLACVLAERCAGLFGGCVEEREVSVEEAAGWAAGWGD